MIPISKKLVLVLGASRASRENNGFMKLIKSALQQNEKFNKAR